MANANLEYKKLVDMVAETLYRNEGGLDDETYEGFFKQKRKEWRIPGEPWDTNPEELDQHVREEYLWQAQTVLECLAKNEVLSLEWKEYILSLKSQAV